MPGAQLQFCARWAVSLLCFERLVLFGSCRRVHLICPNCCEQANNEKLRLETKQRAARKAAERGDPIRPRWFIAVKGATPGVQQAYKYHGGYFEAREQGEWPSVRDIFGPGIVGSNGESLPNSPKKA